jgi:DNA-binding IclR family transcriptional regulator
VHFIESIESARALRVGGRLGKSMPAHCTSTGKVLLAQLSHEQLRRLYPQEKLTRLTPNSIGTRTALLKALATIRTQGWASSAEESEEGVGSLAVALHTSGSARLAVNASMPVSRMSAQTRRSVLTALVAAAEELDQILL